METRGRDRALSYHVPPTSAGVDDARGVVVDTDGHAYGAYGVGERTDVWVRPDGHVGSVTPAGAAPRAEPA